MDGYAVGLQCFRDSAEAAAVACSSVAGVTSAGAVSCSAPSFSAGSVGFTLVTEGASSRIERAASMQLQPCDPVDLTEWGPVVAAWFVAGVAVLCLRSIYTRIFKGES